MNFQHNGDLVFRKKPKIREGWYTAFAQYALEGKDKQKEKNFFWFTKKKLYLHFLYTENN